MDVLRAFLVWERVFIASWIASAVSAMSYQYANRRAFGLPKDIITRRAMNAIDRRDERLVTIAVFDSVIEASLARGALEAAGIRALVPEQESVRLRGTYFAPRGTLQVLESDREG